MHAEKSNFTVSRMARLLEVSRSGFYAWLQREPSKRALRTERVEAKIAWFHGASDAVSGSPRILADLREDGETISRKTVAKAMRRASVYAGSAPAGGRRPRSSTTPTPTRPMRRSGSGTPASSTRYGLATSATCAPGKDGCIWPP